MQSKMDEKCSVWVGSLSLSAKEELLSDLFGKFGPVKSVVIMRDEQGKSRQFAFVNFYNVEVAECAAHVMDGVVVLRQAIKTKGPKELQKLRGESNAGKKDYRMFTDCLFYIDGRDCTWKSGECPFRHCSKAKQTENVCEKWKERQCEKLDCVSRHPRLTRNGSWVNTENGGNRCPSHNAFKCFGECGVKDCNTHFLERLAYLEHVQMMKKKLTNPVTTCSKCQAVFYDNAEKLNHPCHKPDGTTSSQEIIQHFTSTRLQAEKDIVHPVATYPTKPLTIETNMYNTKKLVNFCNNPNINNNNNNYGSSQKAHVDNRHVNQPQQNQPSTIPGDLTLLRPQRKDVEPVGVFWDFENCPIPKGRSPIAIVQKLRSVFFKDRREVEFMCVCDISKEKKSIIEELNKAQVTVVHINSTSKNAADDKLRQSLRRFAHTYCRPATVVLISGDGNFTVELSDLRHRHNFRIICLHNEAASSALLGFADESHRFDLFADDLEAFTPAQAPSKSLIDVLIINLPTTKSSSHIKTRLNKLSDNCGGKVISVSGSKAVIRFPNSDAAFRARRRLDKEELHGCILRASLLQPRGSEKHCVEPQSQQNKKQPSLHEVQASSLTPPLPLSPKALMDVNLNLTLTPEQKPSTNDTRKIPTPFLNHKLEKNTQYSPTNNIPGPTNYYPTQHLPANYPHHPMPYGSMFPQHMIPGNMFPHLSPHRTSSPPMHHPPGMFPPRCPISPVVNSAVRRSPSPDQCAGGGVDLLVTNINEKFTKDEIERKLASVFREHSRVYSVTLHARRGASLRAFVKVPKLLDARLAISKLNNQVVLDKTIHVSIASEMDKQLCYLHGEVETVLREAVLNWLPLATFLANFEKKYRKTFDVRQLEQMRDTVIVNGSTGCQTVTLVENNIETSLVEVDITSFSSDVYKLLHHYQGIIQLASFPALYWLEFHKELRPSTSGGKLVDLVSAIPNVTAVGTGHAQSIQWIKPFSFPCDASRFLDLSCKLVNIFQKEHLFEMTLGQLQTHHLSMYGKQLEPSVFGLQSVEDLLKAFPQIIQLDKTTARPTDYVVSLTQPQRVILLTKQVEELLSQYQDNTVMLSNFTAAYVKYFGQKFKVASFGFNRLTELIKTMPDVAEIHGTGDQRTVTLVHKRKTRPGHITLDELTEKLTKILSGAKYNEISLNSVLQTFHQDIGLHLTLENHGVDSLEELLKRLPGFQVIERKDGQYLQFRVDNTVDELEKYIVALLKQQDTQFLFVKTIPKLFEKVFLKKFPYTMVSLKDILPELNEHFQILGNGNDQIIRPLEDDTMRVDVEFLFCKTAVEILCTYPQFAVPKSTFVMLYRRKLLQRYKNLVEDEQVLENLPCCVQASVINVTEIVSLRVEYRRQILIEQLKELVSCSSNMATSLGKLTKEYRERFNLNLDLALYGFNDVVGLKHHLQGFIEVTFCNPEHTEGQLVLSPLSRFEVETQALLKQCGGCLSLCRFAPAYQQLFNKHCTVSEYGYSKLTSLLAAVPHVCKIVGNGAEKVVIAVDVSIPERICTDLLSVRIISEGSSDHRLLKKDESSLSTGNQNSTQLLCEVKNLSISTANAAKVRNTTRGTNSDKPCNLGGVSRDLIGQSQQDATTMRNIKVQLPGNACVATDFSQSSFAASSPSNTINNNSTPPKANKTAAKSLEYQRNTNLSNPTPAKIRLAANFKFPSNA